MKQTLQSHLRLREALLALKNFSFLRYKPGGKSFWLHPLVHYWVSQRLESYSTRQSLTMCSIGLVASSFGKEERTNPSSELSQAVVSRNTHEYTSKS